MIVVGVNGFAVVYRWLAKTHAYAFYVVRIGFKAAFDDGWEDWKALLVITVAMLFAAFTVTFLLSIGFQHFLLPTSSERFLIVWGPITIGLAFTNYYALVADRKWVRFEAEFRHYSRTMLVWSGIAVWATLILFIVLAYWTGSIASKFPA